MRIAVVDDSREKGMGALEVAKEFGEAFLALTEDGAKSIVSGSDIVVLDFWNGFRKWPEILKNEIRSKNVIVYSSSAVSYSQPIKEFFRKEFRRIGFSGSLYLSLPDPDELRRVFVSLIRGDETYRLM